MFCRIPTLFVLGALYLGAALPAYAADPEPACVVDQVASARKYVNRQVALLEVALVHADFENMKNSFDRINSYLGKCVAPPSLSKETLQGMVCDVDCFAKRAEVPLFIMSELPYLKSGSIIRSTGVESFETGMTIVKQGLVQLARMNFGSVRTDESKPDASKEELEARADQEPFNRFLHAQARLNSIKARLLMAHGDIMYQSISRNRATSLRLRLNAADNAANPGGSEEVDETRYATTDYEEASWVIQEALLDIPETSAFASEKFEFKRLQNDVIERLRSLSDGFLFLNIDPETFTTLSSKDLLSALSTQLSEIKSIEDALDGIITTWKGNNLAEDRQALENDRIKDARSIELKGYEIAALSESAEEIRNQYTKAMTDKSLAIDKLGKDADIFDINSDIMALKFEIQKAKRQASNQAELIRKQAAVEQTAAERDTARDRRDEFRWMIDATLASYNLNFQISELSAERDSLAGQISIRKKDRDALESTASSLGTEQRLRSERINEFSIGIKKLKKTESSVYLASRRPLVMSICALLAQKAKLNGSSESFSDPAGSCAATQVEMSDKQYWEKLLKVRKETVGEDGKILVDKLQSIRRCLVENPTPVPGGNAGSSNCDANGSAEKIAKEIFAEEKRIFDQIEKKNLENRRDLIQAHYTSVEQAQIAITTSDSAFAVAEALGALLIPVSGQRFVTGTAGLGPAIWMETDIGSKARDAYDLAMNVWKHGNEIAKSNAQFESEKKSLNSALEEVKATLAKASEQYKDQGLEEMIKNRTLADITGQDYKLQTEQLATLADGGKFLADMQNAEAFIKSETARVDSEINRHKAELARLQSENTLVAFDVQSFESRIVQENLGIEALDQQIAGVRAQQSGIDLDIDRLDGLSQAALARQDLVKSTLSTVDNLKKQEDLKQAIVNELTARLNEQTSMLTLEQITQVGTVLNDEEKTLQNKITAALAEEEFIKKSKILGDEALALNSEMQSELVAIANQIKEKRSAILATASKPDTLNQGQAMYLASQIVTADLTRGAHEYLRAKKEKMQYVNFLYNLYRSRLNVMSVLSGVENQREDVVPYIVNYEQLMKAVKNCSDIVGHQFNCGTNSQVFSQRALIFAKSQFVVPADSGFMQELLSKGRARLEITPAAMPALNGDPDEKTVNDHFKALGSFRLWDWMNMNSITNLTLMNVVLNLEAGESVGSEDQNCDQQLIVHHLGYGIRNHPMNMRGVPELAIDSDRLDILRPSKSDGADLQEFNAVFNYFDNMNTLPENMTIAGTFNQRDLRYLGAPLIASYEVEILSKTDLEYTQAMIRKCFAGRNLRIGLNYAMPAKTFINSGTSI